MSNLVSAHYTLAAMTIIFGLFAAMVYRDARGDNFGAGIMYWVLVGMTCVCAVLWFMVALWRWL